MSKIYILIKMLIKNENGSKMKVKNQMYFWTMIISSLAMFYFYVVIPAGKFIFKIYDLLAFTNQQGVILSIGLSGVTVMAFIFSIAYVLTSFYFSKDVEILMPLPLSPYQIISAKFITALLYQYLTEVMFLLPLIVAYGIKASLGFVYWGISLIIFLVLPIVPLVASSLINMVIMRFTNIGKHKDAIRTIVSLVSLAMAFGVNILVRSYSQQKIMSSIKDGNNSLINSMTYLFPTAKWATYSLISASIEQVILNMILFVFVSLISIIIFIIVAEKFYFKGAVGSSESFGKRKKINQEDVEKGTNSNSQTWAYVLKELKILYRTPVFFTSCVMASFILPAFFIFGIFMGDDSNVILKSIGMMFQRKDALGVAIGISFAIMLVIGNSSLTASTAISREGKNMYINKYIPISYKKQIFSKILSACIINMANVIIVLLIIIALFNPPIYVDIIILFVGIFSNIIICSIGIIVDTSRPKLNWDNEQMAVKQNLNSFIVQIISYIVAAISVYLTVKIKPNFAQATVSMGLFLIAIVGLLSIYINTKCVKIYSKIE